MVEKRRAPRRRAARGDARLSWQLERLARLAPLAWHVGEQLKVQSLRALHVRLGRACGLLLDVRNEFPECYYRRAPLPFWESARNG